jgi:hypothetical protein
MGGRKRKNKGPKRGRKAFVYRPTRLNLPSAQLGGMVFSPIIRKIRRKRKGKRRNY